MTSAGEAIDQTLLTSNAENDDTTTT